MPDSKSERNEKIEKIFKKVKSCKKCILCEKRTNAVPGSGSSQAQIVFIGEGPGAKEDVQGKPFVGASGKFLDEMLVSIKLDRESVFITNVVKCRPPDNRDPLQEEAEICSKAYLWEQLDIIDPKIVVTLGRHAMHRFLPANQKISEVHGKLFSLTSPKTGRSFNILPLYHPASALYNGSMRDVLLKDFKKLRLALKKFSK